jgi:hypothetical protein
MIGLRLSRDSRPTHTSVEVAVTEHPVIGYLVWAVLFGPAAHRDGIPRGIGSTACCHSP